MSNFHSSALLLLACTVSTSLVAQEHRQHGTHEHGIGKLNLAQDGKELHLELESPAANIVGFEHTPSTEADREALRKAIATLKDGDRLFRFSRDAACRLADARVETPLIDDDGGKAHEHEKHDLHAAEHDPHEAQHTDHEEHVRPERPQAQADGHEDGAETHADITAEYHFTCARPNNLKQLDAMLFQSFPGTERLEVQFITGSRQGAAKLTASSPVLTF